MGFGGRHRGSILVRPLLYVVAGVALAAAVVTVDAATGETLVPAWLRFDPAVARSLFVTLAGATLTIAGITFWVRAAAVQMAASQFTPRVVQGFLHDWFQQSMMGLLLGIFAYLVTVLRALPAEGEAGPHLAVLLGVVLAGGSVLAVLWAIRNGVESMQAGELARRVTDETIARIRRRHPAKVPVNHVEQLREIPASPGHVVRATSSGWVRSIDEARVLHLLGDGALVRLDVRVGLFVREGRGLCTIWSEDGVWLDVDPQIRRAIVLGRSRNPREDVHYGLQQLADIARGSLTTGTADPGAATEAIAHLELVLRELLGRSLPPAGYVDDRGRQMIRRRDYSVDDYVGVAFDELRLAAAPYPTVVMTLLDTLGALVHELEGSGWEARVASLRTRIRLVLAACEQTSLPEEDLRRIRAFAERQQVEQHAAGP